MKKIYILSLLVLCACTYVTGQETANKTNSQTNVIREFKLYPNPAFDDIVYIITTEKDIKDIYVYDVFGEVVLKERTKGNTLNIASLVPGIYVLRVLQNDTVITRKLVVK